MSQIKTKLYTGLDEMFGEMQNLFQEEEEVTAKPDVTQAEENITVL